MQRRIVTLSNRTPLRQVKRVGKDVGYDYEEFTRDVGVLRKYANMRIADVAKEPEIFEVFTRVKRLLNTTSGDVTLHDQLMTIIDNQFSSLLSVIPYTIGALFRGWNITTNMDGTDFESCLAVRIGSIQKPGLKTKCTYVSVYADWTGNGFTFTNDVIDRSTETRSLNKVVINVPFTNVTSFPGFSLEEKQELKNNEITEVCIIGFRLGSNDYYHLTNSTFIPVDSIKTRHPKPQTTYMHQTNDQIRANLKSRSSTVSKSDNKNCNNDGYGAYAWIFFILIIIIILVLFFAFWK